MGFMCMSYGYVYVASVALGYDRQQTLKAFQEAEAYDGPSIIFAYAPCIAHTIDMSKTQTEQKRAVEAGYYPVYRFNPAAADAAARFSWDVKAPANGGFQDFIQSEGRYKLLMKANPAHAEELFKQAESDAAKRMEFIQQVRLKSKARPPFRKAGLFASYTFILYYKQKMSQATHCAF